jgi:glycosyltransferase involved in cell wall biosynthesis
MDEPKIAIITRTKNRPILLSRARQSIEQQTYTNFKWVLVNDAGDAAPVEEEARQAKDQGVNVIVIHRKQSAGMEAASNAGVRTSNSKYVVIHDDDDTWEPNFLSKTVQFLEDNEHYVGVITHSTKILEEMQGNKIITIDKFPYNSWINAVYLIDLAQVNRFPPISFLFRRTSYDKVGGFDETLPVLGDWDFHLRILLQGDIGVISEPLANYHFRRSVKESMNVYGNTVTVGIAKHIQYDAIYRNRKLREDIVNHRIGLGFLLGLGRLQTHIEHRVDLGNSIKHLLITFIKKLHLDNILKPILRKKS